MSDSPRVPAPSSRLRAVRWRGCLVAIAALVVGLPLARAAEPTTDGPQPARGPSLLARMGSSMDRIALGQIGYSGVAPDAPEAASPATADGTPWLVRGFALTGEDLYRINCRACHGAAVRGLASTTPSLVGKIRETVAANPGDANAAAELVIRHQLAEGGAIMPPFAHLAADETKALIGYLETVAGTTDTAALPRVQVPALEVGEHVVKGVCQTCHDATPGLTPTGAKAIPPALSEIPQRWALGELLLSMHARSAAAGGPAIHRPRLGFLTEQELAAGYVYLIAYPPVAP
jgi:mono/diheme cytochrome c family protein